MSVRIESSAENSTLSVYWRASLTDSTARARLLARHVELVLQMDV